MNPLILIGGFIFLAGILKNDEKPDATKTVAPPLTEKEKPAKSEIPKAKPATGADKPEPDPGEEKPE